MDLDVSVMSKGTLRNKVDRLFDSPALRLPRGYGLPAPVVNHYLASAALVQKVRALIELLQDLKR